MTMPRPAHDYRKSPLGSWFSLAALTVLCLGLLAVAAQAMPTVVTVGAFDISFYNTGESDEGGSSTQSWTAQQISDITASINAWTSYIPNAPGRQIKLHLFWDALGGSILGQTASPQSGDGTTSWTYAEHIWRDGVNYSASTSYDVRMDFSTGVNWNFGSGTPTASQYDFRTVVTHEIGHALGFYPSYNSGTDRFSSQGLSLWDKNLMDSSGNVPARGARGTPGNFNQLDNPVYFTGAYAISAYGDYVPVYAPATYNGGSSLSHLDETTFPNALMSPFVDAAQVIRAPSDLEWAIMADLGWGTKTWSKGASSLNWGDANWTPTGTPDAAWHVIFASTGLTAGDSIALGGNRAVKTLRIDSGVGFTLGADGGTLTLQDGNLLRTAAANGIQTIACPVVLGKAANWDISQLSTGTGKLLLTGTLTSAYAFTKNGAGTLAFANTATLGDLALNNGDLTLLAGGALTARSLTGDGILNLDGGTLALTDNKTLHLWGVRVGRDTTASFTLPPGTTFWTDVFVTVGRDAGGHGTLINQGTIKADTNLWLGVNAGSSGTFTQQTGPNTSDPAPNTTVAGTTSLGDTGGSGLLEMKAGTYTTANLLIGSNGPGTVTQTGGTIRVTGALQLAGASTAGTYNLDGGTLITSQLTRATGTGAATFSMGGGTLQAAANLTSSVPITLKTGGGTIDSNGYTVTLTSPVGGTGGLTKTGAGSLLLTSASQTTPLPNTYTGNTVVANGTLQIDGGIDSNGSWTTTSDDTIVGTSSTTATLITEHIRQDTLTINPGSKVTINTAGGVTGTSVVNFLNLADSSGSFSWTALDPSSVPQSVGAANSGDAIAAVPEPGTRLLLLAGALTSLLAWRRTRQNKVLALTTEREAFHHGDREEYAPVLSCSAVRASCDSSR